MWSGQSTNYDEVTPPIITICDDILTPIIMTSQHQFWWRHSTNYDDVLAPIMMTSYTNYDDVLHQLLWSTTPIIMKLQHQLWWRHISYFDDVETYTLIKMTSPLLISI